MVIYVEFSVIFVLFSSCFYFATVYIFITAALAVNKDYYKNVIKY